MDTRLESYDWGHIFETYTDPTHVRLRKPRGSYYSREDVIKIIAIEDGENDENEWIGLFKMNDGKYMCVRAGCDYTGWGCQESGSSDYGNTKKDVIMLGLTSEERRRLNLND